MTRAYSDAIAALNTLQSNFQTVNAIRRSGKSVNQYAIPEMVEYVRRLGYEPSDFDRLHPIHIAGTKGKGSTSAFISSILSQYPSSLSQPSSPPVKTGLYTSPHLRFVRERIQINNVPITEELFAKYFFETWDRLSSPVSSTAFSNIPPRPVYFRFLTLMALHTYMSEGVDSAIIECGIGGEYDSTNVLVQPTVTGITSLGIDHTHLLGETIESIAWHKAGIMKNGVACFSAPQAETAVQVLKERAKERDTNVTIVERDSRLEDVKLGLQGEFQKTNASLAVSIAEAHLSILGRKPSTTTSPSLTPEFVRGLASVHFPGRCETRHDRISNITWYIDSGHTLESITLAAGWLASHLPSPCSGDSTPSTHLSIANSALQPSSRPRILLFNQQTRAPAPLLHALHSTLSTSPAVFTGTEPPFTHVVFCSNRTYSAEGFRPDLQSLNDDSGKVEMLEVQEGMKAAWEGLEKEAGKEGPDGEKRRAQVVVRGSIEEAVAWCRDIAEQAGGEGEKVMVLVTGSVHLIGGFLEVIETGH